MIGHPATARAHLCVAPAGQVPRCRGAQVQPRAAPEFDHSSERDGYRWRGARVGRGARRRADRRLPVRARGGSAEPSVPLPSRDRGVAARAGRLAAPADARRRADAAARRRRLLPGRARRRASGDGPGNGADHLARTALSTPSSTRTAARSSCVPRARSSATPTPSTTGTENERSGQPLRRRRRGRSRQARRATGTAPARLGPSIGADRLGGTVYELDPGDSMLPYHYEGVEEEWLLVLTGTPTLRDPDGEHELAPGDAVCFRAGPRGRPQGDQPLGRRHPGAHALDGAEARSQHRDLSRQRQGRGLALARQAPAHVGLPSSTGTARSSRRASG